MLANFQQIISLDNLGSKGQIATLLILIMVGVLVFILATVNIGEIAVNSTKLSNAADSASLMLGSRLGTKAGMLRKALGGQLSKCSKSSMLSVILAVIVFIVIVVATEGTGMTVAAQVAWGIAGATVAGAVGAAITGTDIALGAAQGFAVGCMMGAAYGAPYLSQHLGLMAAGTAKYLAMASLILAAGAKLYNTSVQSRMSDAAFAQAARKLSELPEYDYTREGSFLTALGQTVDDPNQTTDTVDSDKDGDTTEMVTHFQWWWHKRVDELKSIVPPLKSYTSSLFSNTMDDFSTALEDQYSEICTTVSASSISSSSSSSSSSTSTCTTLECWQQQNSGLLTP